MNKNRTTFLKLLPITIPFVGLFLIGIGLALTQSFGYLIPVDTDMKGWDVYISLFNDKHFYTAFFYSLYIAFMNTTGSLLIGTFFAVLIWRLPHRYQRWAIIYKLFLILPHITVAFIVIILFSQSGILSSLLHQFGWQESMQQFPSLLYGNNGLGTIFAYMFKNTPFVILMLLSILIKLDEKQIQTAKMLGAPPVQIFMRIIRPQLMPMLHSTGIILFLYSFGAFEIPFIFGEQNMLSITTFNIYFKTDLINRPHAMAMLMVMFVFSVCFVFVYFHMVSKLQNRERKI